MSSYLIENEALIRASSFLAVLLLMMLVEYLAPRRPRVVARQQRWPANLGLVICSTLLLRLMPFMAATAVALKAAEHEWGLFNQLQLPAVFLIPACVVLLDLLIYFQHRLFHAVPVLWRLHRVHHSDVDLDVTSGARFHPVEIVLSMLIKMIAVLLLGAPLAAVILFELILNASAMFNHSNISLPNRLDAVLRMLIVTPDMHRIHHSVIRKESDSNYGFALSVWDRLFSTYKPRPQAGQLGMTIGQRGYANEGMIALLIQPARNDEE